MVRKQDTIPELKEKIQKKVSLIKKCEISTEKKKLALEKRVEACNKANAKRREQLVRLYKRRNKLARTEDFTKTRALAKEKAKKEKRVYSAAVLEKRYKKQLAKTKLALAAVSAKPIRTGSYDI